MCTFSLKVNLVEKMRITELKPISISEKATQFIYSSNNVWEYYLHIEKK